MNILFFKTVSSIAILFTGLIGGLLSVKLAASARREEIFSLGSAFAGGIFLGAGLIHMLPDAREGFKSVIGDQFPWAFLLCACGFLLVLFVEKVLLHGHSALTESGQEKPGGSFYAYVIMVVLSIHSIIAGIALGTEEIIVKALIILIAIMAHKGSAAFALGVSLNRAGIQASRLVKIVLCFSFMTPIGIILGSTLTHFLTGSAEQICTSVFDALAAGTFLYVALIEIIEHEFDRTENRLLKFVLLSFGLGLMAMLAIWV